MRSQGEWIPTDDESEEKVYQSAGGLKTIESIRTAIIFVFLF